MATHSSNLAQKFSWTEKPGRLQSVGRKELDTTERLYLLTYLLLQQIVSLGYPKLITTTLVGSGWVWRVSAKHLTADKLAAGSSSRWSAIILLRILAQVFPSPAAKVWSTSSRKGRKRCTLHSVPRKGNSGEDFRRVNWSLTANEFPGWLSGSSHRTFSIINSWRAVKRILFSKKM